MTTDPFRTFKEQHELRAVMEADGVVFKGSKARCPFHADDTPSLSIKRGDDGFQFFRCFGCGATGDVITYLSMRTGKQRREIVGGKIVDLPKKPVNLDAAPAQPPEPFHYEHAWDQFEKWNQALLANEKLMGWLADRGIDRQACIMNLLGHSQFVEGLKMKRKLPMLVIPNFKPSFPLSFTSVEVRHLKHKGDGSYPPKYQTTGTRELWHLPLLYRDADRMIILVESCFDAMAINRMVMRHIATAIPANGFKDYHARQLAQFQRVFVLADPGAPGQEHAKRVKSLIRSTEIIDPGLDFGDLHRQDWREAYRLIAQLVKGFYDLIDNAPLMERTA